MKIILKLSSIVGVFILMLTSLSCADFAKKEKEIDRPKVEAVFVLDTTGSMGGMIHGAKEKIWSIANTLASAKPTPEIRIGLIAYRDKGDIYVTNIIPMSSDLDTVYNKLMDFQAQGGGDTPESVNRALSEAISQNSWSKDRNTYKVVFLVGDCPPHMDYKDDIKYPESCKIAAENGIVVNTVLCGNNSNAKTIWKKIATLTNGQFMQVAQGGNAIVMSTPYDLKMSKLSKLLDKTRIYYGTKSEIEKAKKRAEASNSLYDKLSDSAKAQRSFFNSSKAGEDNFLRGKELVKAYNENQEIIKDIPVEDLPEELSGLNIKQLEEYIRKKSIERLMIQKEIRELSEKRQNYIKKELEKDKGREKSSLEHKVYDAVKKQSKGKNVKYNAPRPKM